MAKTNTQARTISMTPYELFKLQVQGVYEAFRRQDYNYLPPSMGGISGQRKVIESEAVLTVVNVGK